MWYEASVRGITPVGGWTIVVGDPQGVAQPYPRARDALTQEAGDASCAGALSPQRVELGLKPRVVGQHAQQGLERGARGIALSGGQQGVDA